MRIILLGLFLPIFGICSDIWVDMGSDPTHFQDAVYQDNGQTISQQQLTFFENKNVEQSSLLSKIDFWSKKQLGSKLLDKEISDLQTSHVFSQDNRLLLFEFLKSSSDNDATSFLNLCRFYANDTFLKTSEPFFESSCNLSRHSIKDLNPTLAQFDFLLIDGNKIDLKMSPYFFSTDSVHQFVFISNRLVTIEITGTSKSLQRPTLTAQPWVDGKCDSISKSKLPDGANAKIFFSKDCLVDIHGQTINQESFISRNRYYIVSALVLIAIASTVSSHYDLAVGLNP